MKSSYTYYTNYNALGIMGGNDGLNPLSYSELVFD